MDGAIDGTWIRAFSGLDGLTGVDRNALIGQARIVALRQGDRIYGPGQAPASYLLLLGGTVRVHQIGSNGRELVLFRVMAGEACALTTACLLAYTDYPAEAIAETEVSAVAIPRAAFDALIASSADFRRFVFKAFSLRVTDLFHLIEEVAFARIDVRLAQKLIERSDDDETIFATQQQLAAELGTAREVVGRMLAEFQRRQWVEVGRGAVRILDRTRLARLAQAENAWSAADRGRV